MKMAWLLPGVGSNLAVSKKKKKQNQCQFLPLVKKENQSSTKALVQKQLRKTGGDKQGKDGKENKRREKLTNSNGTTTSVQTLCKVLQVPALM